MIKRKPFVPSITLAGNTLNGKILQLQSYPQAESGIILEKMPGQSSQGNNKVKATLLRDAPVLIFDTNETENVN